VRTALVVPVPEAAPLVDPWRERTMTSPGLPPHVTLTFPFVPAAELDAALLEELRALFAGFRPFDFSLRRFERFYEWLVLDPEPAEPFVELTRAVLERWPEFPRYGGAYGDEIVPHLSVAQAEHEAAERAVAPGLPLAARATEAILLEEVEAARWRTAAQFRLGD
jgi:2'-5' RNA ligase